MNFYLSFLFLILVAVLQVSAAPEMAVGEATPELIVIVVVTWTMLRGGLEGMRWAITAGLVLAVISPAPMGAHLLALAAVALVVGIWQRTVSHANPLWCTLAVLVGALVYGAILAAILRLTGHGIDLSAVLVTEIVPAALYSALLAIPGYFLLRRLDHRFALPAQPEW